ncbi:MAG: Trm112 family protein [Deltaproteobacteria bacterium]|nr:Trm112 family protein [Deltaproteobacteria bacterium]
MTVDSELLSILVCPACKGGIKLNDAETGIVCEKCRLLFPVEDGIPVMMIEEAKPLGR